MPTSETEMYRLPATPEAVLDMAIFVGDGFTGQIWSRKEVVEDGKKWIQIQWEPEDMLFRILKLSPKAQKIIDKHTGRTITRRYPKARVQDVNDSPWARRVVIFTDFIGNEVELINIDKRINDENQKLEKENRQLRNENGWLWSELERSESRISEHINAWAERFKIAAKVRWDVAEEATPEAPQAQYMGGMQQ